MTTFTDANSHAYTFQYDQPGRLTNVFAPANPATADVVNVYDSLSRVKTQANARAQVWTYYFAGARSEADDPLGNKQVWYFNRLGSTIRSIDALGFETDTVYDGLNRKTQVTMPEGNKSQWTYDLMNNVLSETKVPKSGSGLSNVVSTWAYDATYNKRHTLLDPRGNTWTWNYDAATGNLLSFVKPIVGGLTPQESWTYNTRGQILTHTDETSIVTKFTYDATTEKRLTQIVDYAVSGHLNLTTSYGYNAWGDVNSVTDPNTNITQFTFNNERFPTQKTEPTPFGYLTKYGYDNSNNLTSIQRQVTSTPTFYTTSIVYSVTNQKHTVTDPMGYVQTWDYDGKDRLQKYTDAQSRLWQYAYDALDRLYTTTDPSTTISDTRLYSNNGLLASIKDANNNLTQYTRDGFDRLDKTIYADTSYEQISSYDANDNALIQRTRSANTITNTFDALNRLATKSPTGQAVVTLGYDLAGRKTSSSTPVVAGNPASGNFQFFFDGAGRYYKETTPDGKNITYQLDSNGNITKLTYADGYFVTRVIDQMNRLTDVKLNGASTAALHFDYDQLSRRTKLTYGNAAVVNYGYQSNNDMTSLAQVFNGTTSVTFTYGFNNAHQENSRAVTDGTYLWHPAGAATTTYGAANNVNEYPTVGGVSYSYDGNANLSGDGTWTFGYDTENHLLTATKTGVSASYVYDGSHRQIQKVVATTKTRFVYAQWQRIADYDGTANTLQNRYVYGVELDEPLIQVSSGAVLTYLHADRIGSIIATTNSSGTVTNSGKYSSFGENAPVGTTFGFTGQRYDSETGLYYYKRRYYSSIIGRFLQPDPIKYTAGLNLYTYANNDPLNLVDPLGLLAELSPPPPPDKDDLPPGTSIYINPDGSTTYIYPDGSYTTVRSDGSYTIHYTDGGITVVDVDGHILMDQPGIAPPDSQPTVTPPPTSVPAPAPGTGPGSDDGGINS